MSKRKSSTPKAIREAVIIRIRQVSRAQTPEERLALAAVEQGILDVGEKESHWDRGTEENPDSTEAWLDGRMEPYCKAAGLEVDWVVRLLKGVGLL